jgi:Co/Zn/Cd efflux system component
MAGEIVFGVAAGSLALLEDAGHLLTDSAALALALGAATFAGRPARGRWTFGFRRLEILAAHVNGITLVVVGVVIVYTAIRRLIDPPDVRGGVVLVVAALSFWSSLTLLRESTRILLEVAPDEPGEVAGEMLSVPAWSRCTTCTSGRSGAASRPSRRMSWSSLARTATRSAWSSRSCWASASA